MELVVGSNETTESISREGNDDDDGRQKKRLRVYRWLSVGTILLCLGTSEYYENALKGASNLSTSLVLKKNTSITQVFGSNSGDAFEAIDGDTLVVDSPPSKKVSNNTAGPPPKLIACSQSQNKSESIEQLLQAIKADREYNGLRALNVTVNEDGVGSTTSLVRFEGVTPNLFQRAFFNRTGRVSRVIIGGDSTLQYPSEKLVFLEDNPHLMVPRNLSEANEAVESALDGKVFPDGSIMKSKETRTKKRQHEYVNFRRSKPEGCDASREWKIITYRDPEVLVVNMGLHWLHFQTVARDIKACQVKRWLDYEELWLQSVLDNARRLPSLRLLLFKTTNYICDGMYVETYAEANKLYHAKDKATMDSCKAAIQSMLPGRDEKQIESFCHDGSINEQGVAYLNARLLKFVQKLQPEEGNLTVHVFNDHDIESCEYTTKTDGRHYHTLNLIRLRYLANVITCYLDDDS